MQNKHQFFFLVLGVPTLGEGGGGDLVGPNSQFFPKIRFEGSPNHHWSFILLNAQNVDLDILGKKKLNQVPKKTNANDGAEAHLP